MRETCEKCGNIAWGRNPICPNCCTHDLLEFRSECSYEGPWRLTAYCIECSFELGDDHDVMEKKYIAIRKEIADAQSSH